MNFKNQLLALAIGFGLLAGAGAQPALTGKHATAGLNCAACHQSDAPTSRAPASACQTCHGNNAAVAEKTKDVKPNPHASHEGELRCTKCHRAHSPSVIYCNECHQFQFKLK